MCGTYCVNQLLHRQRSPDGPRGRGGGRRLRLKVAVPVRRVRGGRVDEDVILALLPAMPAPVAPPVAAVEKRAETKPPPAGGEARTQLLQKVQHGHTGGGAVWRYLHC